MHITLSMARQGMHALVHVAPDRRALCRNVTRHETGRTSGWSDDKWTYTPECIVGTFLYALGADAERLYNAGSAEVSIRELGWTADEDALAFLAVCQTSQDHGATWFTAYNRAVEEIIIDEY